MAHEFDPYAAWLSIRETARPLSHYQLLGLAEFEENPLAITIAADAAVARLKRTDPGDRRGRWQQTLDEVTLAKLCLTNRTRKLQYDTTLRERRERETTVSLPTSETPSLPNLATVAQEEAGSAPAWTNSDLFPPTLSPAMPVQPASVPVMQPTASPVAQPVTFAQPIYAAIPAAQPIAAPIGMPIGYSAPFASPMPGAASAMMPVPIAIPVEPAGAAPGAFGPPEYAAKMPSRFERAFGSEPPATADAPIASEAIGQQAAASFELEMVPGRRPVRRSTAHSAPDPKVWGIAAAVALALLMGFVVFKMQSRPVIELTGVTPAETVTVESTSSASQPEQSTVAPAEPAHATRGASASQPADPMPKPSAPAKQPKAPEQPRSVAMTQIEIPDAAPPSKSKPVPAPQPKPDPPAQTPEQKEAFEKALRNARAAMGARKLPLAQQELKSAKANVSSAEQDTQLARLEELYGYVEGFWKAVFESMKGFQATDTLPIDNTEIAIVEVDGEKLTIRAAGRNLSYTLESMPSGLALALAKRWFKAGQAANNLYLGAFHAVDPQGNLNEARRCWEAATRGGASAESLMPLLEERTQGLVTEQQPVPPKAVHARARAALVKSMPDEFRMAKSLDRKLALARQLLDAAAQSENPIERYTLYTEALSLAGDAGNVTDMTTALDGLIAGYKLDPWELRAKAFDAAADSANNPLVAKAMAKDMLEIVDQAIEEKQPAAALKLCNAMLSAAKKGKDLELVRQASDRKARLTGDGK